MIRSLVIRLCLVAAAHLAAAPLGAQPVAPQAVTDPLVQARAAEARLDFAAALAALAEAIADRPNEPAALLARADLHRKMNRPALALADLEAVLATDPGNGDALRARAWLHLALGVLSRAATDFDTVLAAAPDDVEALIGRARARTRSGLTALALADYETALALAPDTPGLAQEHAALARPAPPDLRYDPAALMDPAFVVEEGAPGAAARLLIVHAGNDLAREEALLPRAEVVAALEAEALSVTHLFTYTGQDSAIWANLALICAGPEGFSATWAALTGDPARAALAAIDAGGGRAGFEALVAGAYAEAGLEAGRGPDCAFSRAKAVGYLAEWSDKREAEAWQGRTFYDAWPVFVLDGAVASAAEVRGALAALAPVEDRAQAPTQDGEPVAPDAPDAPLPPQEPSSGTVDEEPEGTAPPGLAEAEATAPSDAPKPAAEAAATLEPEHATAAASAPEPEPLPAGIGPVDPAARIPAQLRGIWAPTLVDCIAYTDAIANATRLDAALPALNPLDGPAIGTVLLTSRRIYLFNVVATDCDLVSAGADDTVPYMARLACRNAIAADIIVPMTIARLEGAGPAPRLGVRFGSHDETELVQCRPLGALGSDFAPLWQVEPETCRVSAPVTGARFAFTVDNGALVLTISPDSAPKLAADGTLAVALDGVPLAVAATWRSGAWRAELGPFEAMATPLASGLLLEATVHGPDDAAARWRRTLPLLGSGRAMAALADCAGD